MSAQAIEIADSHTALNLLQHMSTPESGTPRPIYSNSNSYSQYYMYIMVLSIFLSPTCSIADLNAGMTLLLDARNSRTHTPTKHLLEKLVVGYPLVTLHDVPCSRKLSREKNLHEFCDFTATRENATPIMRSV